MYQIALSVAGCLAADTRVDVALLVEATGFPPHDPTDALAVTPGGGRMGSLLSGALDDQLAALATEGVTNRLLTLHVDEVAALIGGLPGPGTVRCLLLRAADLPEHTWSLLQAGAPICLIATLDGDRVTATTVHPLDELPDDLPAEVRELAAPAGSRVDESPERVIAVLRPVPRLLVVGGGPIAGPVTDALAAASAPLGWRVQRHEDAATVNGVVAGLTVHDSLVVMGHDDELTGRALAAALAGPAGYLGALGGRALQQQRADWLATRGYPGDLGRIHGPAGLDIGARSPAEIAIAILAEAIAVHAHAAATGRF